MSLGPILMLVIGLGVALVVGVWAISRAIKQRNEKKPKDDKQDENKPTE